MENRKRSLEKTAPQKRLTIPREAAVREPNHILQHEMLIENTQDYF